MFSTTDFSIRKFGHLPAHTQGVGERCLNVLVIDQILFLEVAGAFWFPLPFLLDMYMAAGEIGFLLALFNNLVARTNFQVALGNMSVQFECIPVFHT